MKSPNSNLRTEVDTSLSQWRNKEKAALELLKIAGELRFDFSIDLLLFRRNLYDARPSEVLKGHTFAKNYSENQVDIFETLEIAHAVQNYPSKFPSKLDIGKIALEWRKESTKTDLKAFVHNILENMKMEENKGPESADVVLYGFGRIGRLVARQIIDYTGGGKQLRLKAIVIRPKLKDRVLEIQKRASLLRKDSVHGPFQGVIEVDAEREEIIVNGNRVRFIFAGHPTDIDYTEYGIENGMVIDNTGVWRDKESLSVHLRPGIKKVLFTAPAAGVPNIVYGVNHHEIDEEKHAVICAASCTTNAIVPIISTVLNKYGIEQGHIETVHSYTSDQNLLDNFHKKPRRGRAAAINMVITSTGAAKAVSKVIPQLEGKLSGNAVRVPTPDVSLAILNLQLKTTVDVASFNSVIQQEALKGDLVEQIKYSTATDFVSNDAIGSTVASIFDAPSTIVSHDKKNVTAYVWYDNEYGYSCQVIRCAKYFASVRRPCYY